MLVIKVSVPATSRTMNFLIISSAILAIAVQSSPVPQPLLPLLAGVVAPIAIDECIENCAAVGQIIENTFNKIF